jgi:hypothetical protein
MDTGTTECIDIEFFQPWLVSKGSRIRTVFAIASLSAMTPSKSKINALTVSIPDQMEVCRLGGLPSPLH